MSQYRRKLRITSDKLSSPSPKAKHEITPAALYELFESNSQCVKAQEGRCPLLVFTVQFAEAINQFFSDED